LKDNIEISIVSPVYQAENIVDELVNRLQVELNKITESYEIILIEDGSPDESWKVIEKNCNRDARVKGIKLSRNFGQHHAITAGLDQCKGEWVVVMDCDLQDRPEEITNLYNKANDGFEVVYARRSNRKHSFFKKITSHLFYVVLTLLSGIKFNGEIGNFGIYKRNVIQEVKRMREPFRFFVTSIKWLGFNSTGIKVNHDSRFEGKSSYSYMKLIKLGLDVSISYSNKPLMFLIYIGAMISVSSILVIMLVIYRKLIGQITELGYTSIISSIWFLSGMIISSIGVLGIYIGKIFDGIKNRPIYVVAKKLNDDKEVF
jgi:dolichol-phosphate mannosyltransferase